MHNSSLSHFQQHIATLFFAAPQSAGFLLAGGAAMIATGITNRPTQDLDIFAPPHVNLEQAATTLEKVAATNGYRVHYITREKTFIRMIIHAEETVLVDLANDAPAQFPPTATFIGPSFAPEELAARKILALYSRAEPRDFLDTYQLLQQFSSHQLLAWAATLDPGFVPTIFAEMLDIINRYPDSDFDQIDVHSLRTAITRWAQEIRSNNLA